MTQPASLNIAQIYGKCPVQAEGTLDGKPLYFRARHEEWSFSVALDGGDPVDVFTNSDIGFYCEEQWGTGPEEAGYMDNEEAARLIKRCAEEYFAVKQQQ